MQAQVGNIFPTLGNDDESMRTDGGENDNNHADPVVSAIMPFRPDEGNQIGERDSSEVEHPEGGWEEEEEEEEEENGLDKRTDKPRMQALRKQAQQGSTKKRRAPRREPPKKRMKTNPETSYEAAEMQARALESTRALELSLADLPDLPHGIIEPHAVYLMLQDRCQHQPEEDLRLLNETLFPDWFTFSRRPVTGRRANNQTTNGVAHTKPH
jgi:hypothetical protein